eukprot:CAMPEP_0175047144 /NCGR_PEP_ID=MMETSP0052_2-20121109/5427_1 /TAXON_ID=51329 ORGANISM="Polytomella parva, Strain SAG 63-3" /NCGR_SAMPLE_ID=MMETSP0052_2 /ASSEMBLY_ACC=CAM_ASM_000194 /LENGTH=1095 /DNA_ID=CAMNT_0016310977 /DNA_START=211 /DNA_END=3500 /DNA_ORIENTATION=+
MDHCAALPYLLRKTNFRGRVFMTHPTKAVYYSLLKDFVHGNVGTIDEGLYSLEDLNASMDMIEVIDFYEVVMVSGIQISAYRAGHVLGAAMFRVEIHGLACLYTGDYSCVPDRCLPPADVPQARIDIVIVESTYGVRCHPPARQREQLLLRRIRESVSQGGRVLMPVVAMGRAQEILLLLDEHWHQNTDVQHVPIYQTVAMHKALSAYQTYVAALSTDLKRIYKDRNPFHFRHVQTLRSSAKLLDYSGPCVAMATPSGLQGAYHVTVLTRGAISRNTCIVCDFAVQGTLARQVMDAKPAHVTTKEGQNVPLRMAVHAISFSAHADFRQTSGFLEAVQPKHVVLVHGEREGMLRLADALKKAKEQGVGDWEVYTPSLAAAITIQQDPDLTIRIQGKLAEKDALVDGSTIRGVLVQDMQRFGSEMGGGGAGGGAKSDPIRGVERSQLMTPEDLSEFTKLLRGRVTQQQILSFKGVPFSAIRLALEIMFDGVREFGHLPVYAVRDDSSSSHDDGQDADREDQGTENPSSSSLTSSPVRRHRREARTLLIGRKVAITCLQSSDDAVRLYDGSGRDLKIQDTDQGRMNLSIDAIQTLSTDSAAGRLLKKSRLTSPLSSESPSLESPSSSSSKETSLQTTTLISGKTNSTSGDDVSLSPAAVRLPVIHDDLEILRQRNGIRDEVKVEKAEEEEDRKEGWEADDKLKDKLKEGISDVVNEEEKVGKEEDGENVDREPSVREKRGPNPNNHKSSTAAAIHSPDPKQVLGTTTVVLEWEGDRRSDLIADAVITTILQAIGPPPAMAAAERSRAEALAAGDLEAAAAAELEMFASLLGTQFGALSAEVDAARDVVILRMRDELNVTVRRGTGAVESVCDASLAQRIAKAAKRLLLTLRQLPVAEREEEEAAAASALGTRGKRGRGGVGEERRDGTREGEEDDWKREDSDSHSDSDSDSGLDSDSTSSSSSTSPRSSDEDSDAAQGDGVEEGRKVRKGQVVKEEGPAEEGGEEGGEAVKSEDEEEEQNPEEEDKEDMAVYIDEGSEGGAKDDEENEDGEEEGEVEERRGRLGNEAGEREEDGGDRQFQRDSVVDLMYGCTTGVPFE